MRRSCHAQEVVSRRGRRPASRAPAGPGRAPARRRGRVAARERTRLGPLRRRVPGHPRRVPRRRRLRVGARGPDRGGGGRARRRRRQGRARGRVRRRPVLALDPRPGRPRPTGSTSRIRQLQHSRRIDDETGIAVPSVLGTATAPAVRRRLASTSSSRRSARCSSSATSTSPSPRPRGCCARAAGSRSRSPTRPGGCSPTTRARPGLVASQSYWDRTPYVEVDDATGQVAYVEHHRTLGDWVALLAGARLRDHRPARAGVARGPRPGLGRLVTGPRAAHARAPRSSAPGCA